jgi:Holliday junction resolvase RusA-like endonuclease
MIKIPVTYIPTANNYVRHFKAKGGKIVHCKIEKAERFEKEVMERLPAFIGGEGELNALHIAFVLKSDTRDIDNLLKIFIDCLAKRYRFNDKIICWLFAQKIIDRKANSECVMFQFLEESRIDTINKILWGQNDIH